MKDHSRNKPYLTSPLQPEVRVMIRRRLDDAEREALAGTPDEKAHLTDVVGTVLEVDDDWVTLRTRTAQVRVRRADIVTAKQIPQPVQRPVRPHKNIGVRELDEVMAAGWVAREQEWMGQWLLREGGGYTGRANSCLLLGQPDRPLDAALRAVQAWYETRGTTPLIQVSQIPLGGPDADRLIDFAEREGWEWFQHTLVLTAATREVLTAAQPESGRDSITHASAEDRAAVSIEVTDDITPAWWSLADDRMTASPDAARSVLTGSSHQRFVTLLVDDVPTARARVSVSGGWAGIYALATRPDARGQGHGRAVTQACAQEAIDAGASSLYLQVSADNDAAIDLYHRLGFTTHHSYVYLRPSDVAAPTLLQARSPQDR